MSDSFRLGPSPCAARLTDRSIQSRTRQYPAIRWRSLPMLEAYQELQVTQRHLDALEDRECRWRRGHLRPIDVAGNYMDALLRRASSCYLWPASLYHSTARHIARAALARLTNKTAHQSNHAILLLCEAFRESKEYLSKS